MKVVVIGAHGGVGEHVIQELRLQNYQSLAVVGNENQIEGVRDRGADEVMIYDENSIDSLFMGAEAVIYLSDVSPNSHTDKTVLVDHSALINTVQAAERQGIRRFVMLSAVKAEEHMDNSSTTAGIGAKDMPDELLRKSDIVFTIVCPATLVDKPGQGTISAGGLDMESTSEISRVDAAAVLVESIQNEAAYNRTFAVSSGEKPIKEALSELL